MKHLFPLLFLTVSLCGQQSKLVFGNFVVNNQVYQYKCEKDKSLYKFSVSSLEPKNAFADFNQKQADSVMTELQTIKAKAADEKEKTKIAAMEGYFQNIKDLLAKKESWKNDKSVNDSIDKWAKDIKLTDKNAAPLIEAYKVFLNRNNNYNESTEKNMQSLVLNNFRILFRSAFSEISNYKLNQDTSGFIPDEVFYSIKTRMDFKDDEPLTAYLILKKKYTDIDFTIAKTLTQKTKNKKGEEKTEVTEKDTTKTIRCKVEKVTVEFDEGTIKNVFIDVVPQLKEYNAIYGNTTIRYRNNKPISISSKFDPDKFNNNFIFVSNENELLKAISKTIAKNRQESSILLSDILDLKIVPENDKEDYSPANCLVELSESSAIVELKKEKRSRLFTAIGYSDLAGLNQNNQNGLVQLEITRRCNINTWKTQGFFGCKTKKGKSYTGWLNYFKPLVALNKIETNNKYLFLKTTAIDTTLSFRDSSNHFIVNPLYVYQYRTFNLQGSLNLFNWNLPNKKIALHANYFVNYSSTLITDSFAIKNHGILNRGTQNTERVGSFMHGPDMFIEYKPENRFGLTVGSSIGFQNILNDYYKPDSKYKNGILKIYAMGFLKTNDESKIFFRFAYNQTMASKGNNFYQVQLGYLVDLFTSGK